MRVICWFSCGAASAVAAKIALRIFPDAQIVSCDTRPSEHDDNYRFSRDCERWFGVPIIYLRNERYKDVDDVIEKERYMSGPKGAKCTTVLKKIPRLRYSLPDDTNVFGFTADEQRRIRDFENRNPDLRLQWVLRDAGITKRDCYRLISEAGISLPAMYHLGFDNNNCPGCLKASSPWYWDMVRTHFPAVFDKRCAQSRALGVRLVEIKHHVRIFLDELPPGPFRKMRSRQSLSCGPECGGAPPFRAV